MIKRSLLTFAVTSHNEDEKYLYTLLAQLATLSYPIVVLDDFSTNSQTIKTLDYFDTLEQVSVHRRALNKDFAAQKNHLTTLCDSDYIFQIDADELLSDELMNIISTTTLFTVGADLFLVPRINTVDGLTPEDIQRYRWQVNEKGWIQFPDYQTRLYRNCDYIKWEGAVHERITGYKTYAALPNDLALIHHKDIERQRKQNEFYETI